MATRTVKARVEIDGEKEYKNALSELNKGNQVLASEMRKLQAQYKGNEDSTEALTAKGELLERQLLQQKDKVQTLREALQRAAAEYGEADQRTQEWTIKLNNAEAAQYELEHSIEENTQALQGQSQEMVGLGDGLDDLAGKLGIHVPDAAKKALNGMGEFSAGTLAKMGIAAAAVAAVIKEVEKLQKLTLESAAKADEILTESLTSGLSTKTLQEWEYASEFIDVSTSTMTGALTKLTQGMAKAKSGNEETAAAFARLGVAIYDQYGELRRAEDVFYDAIDALGKIENVTDRDAAAMELMGKSAQELNPLIVQGSRALKEYAAEAEEMGYVLDESQLQKLSEVDDAYQQLQKQLESTKDTLALEFATGSKQAMETFAKVVGEAGKALENSGIIKGLGEILSALSGMLEPLMNVLGLIPNATKELQPLYQILHAIAQAIALIADTANLISGLMPWNWGSGKARTALGLNASSGQYSNLQKVNGVASYYDSRATSGDWVYDAASGQWVSGTWYAGRNASGNDNWRGGLTYLSENGPETAVLPSGTRIYSAQDTALMGGDTFNFTVDVRSLEDLDALIRWAKGVRVRERMR